jgi:hypothetical protein
MIICDFVWKDPYTGKHTLGGTFSGIEGTGFPLIHPIMSVYISLTEGRGLVPIRLQLIDTAEEREAVFQLEQEVDFPDPRSTLETSFVARDIQFPQAGEYRLQLFASEAFLLERRLVVLPSQCKGLRL